MSKIKKFFSKKFGIISTIVGVGLTSPSIVFALPSWQDGIWFMAEGLFRFFLWPAIALLRLELWLLPKIASYNNFTREPGVIEGWIVVRNLTNTFFIVILLIIAFATILRISSYGYKQLLARLLIVAILVNFSMTIVGLVIDFSQIIMLTFLGAIKSLIAGNIMTGLGLQYIFNFTETNVVKDETIDLGELIASMIMAAIMLIITVVIMGAFIGMLAMRIVKLWISIVLAPAAFVAFVFPNAKKYYNQWSMDLGKNLMTGPALLFFLWLAFTIIRGANYQETMEIASINEFQRNTEALDTNNAVKYIIGTALLLGGLQFAAKSGAAGSSLMGKASAKMNSAASGIGKRYVGGVASRTGALASKALIDSKGNARGKLPSRIPVVGGRSYSSVPFWGGRLQRSAMKMQGYNQARIAKERAGDQQYVPPEMQEAFQESQATPYNSGSGNRAWRAAGQAVSFATSVGGGNLDAQVKLAQNRVDNDEIDTVEKAEHAVKHLGNDRTRRDKVQDVWANEISDEDAARYAKRKGASSLSNLKAESMVEENGDVTKGARNMIDAVTDDDKISTKAMIKSFENAPKEKRKAGAAVAIDAANRRSFDGVSYLDTEDGEHGMQKVKLNSDGTVKYNQNNGIIQNTHLANALDPKAAKGVRKRVEDKARDDILNDKVMLSDDFHRKLPKRVGETDKELEDRRQRAADRSKKYDEKYQDVNEDPNATDKDKANAAQELAKKRRHLAGLYRPEEIPEAREGLEEQHDNGQIDDDEYEDRRYAIDHAGVQQRIDVNNAAQLNAAVEARMGASGRTFDINDPKYTVDPENNKEDAKEIDRRVSERVTDDKVQSKMRIARPDGTQLSEDQAREEVTEEERRKVVEEMTTEKETLRNTEAETYDDQAQIISQAIRDGFAGMDENGNIKDGALDSINEILRGLDKDDPRRPALENQVQYISATNELKQIEAQLSGMKQDDPRRAGLESDRDKTKARIREADDSRNELIGRGEDPRLDIISSSVPANMSSGMDYSELTGLDTSDPQDKRVIQNFAVHASDGQQRQFYNDANDEQLWVFAQALAAQGKQISRQIMTSFDENRREQLQNTRLQARGIEKAVSDSARSTQGKVGKVGDVLDDMRMSDD